VNLDPLSIPYRVAENGVRIAVLVVFAVVTGTSSGSVVFGPLLLLAVVVLGLAAITAWEVAYHRRFAYAETDDTFDITSGVLSRRRREIPYERIQNVDIAQNPIQRLLGIAELRLETAGGSDTEAELRFVDTAEASRLQDAISTAKRRRGTTATGEAEEAAPADGGEEVFRLGDRELAILGLVSTDLRVLGLLTVGASVFAPALARELSPGPDLLLWFGPLLGLVSLVGIWVVGGLRAVARYYRFRLVRRAGELRYTRGLFQRYSGTIPLEKIQTVSVRENVLARALGYASVRIETAGYAPGQTQGDRIQSAVPIARREKALALAREIEPVPAFDFERPPTRARTRYAVRYGLLVALAVGAAWLAHRVTGQVSLWPATALLFVLVLPAAHLKWRHLGYYVGETHVVTRRGFWSRRTVVVPYHRVQTVLRSQTVFQRRRRLGTLVVDTASSGGILAGDATALDVDAEVAARLRETVASRLQTALGRRGADSPPATSGTPSS
jgi:putative membrane protein